uniref:NADP-dependent 3-hydroxy acid dehydrogenase YdfG n=1 Tax=Ditylenchus dipsaci TaxID=166011 RepID=A0A915CWB7_9BILA
MMLVERQVLSAPSKPSPGNRLSGKVCIVTGASEGIGEAIARALAVEGGAKVVLASRQINRLRQLAQQICAQLGDTNKTTFVDSVHSRVVAVECDVTSQEAVQQLVTKTLQHFGKIDVLVNCAGCMYYCLLRNGYTEEWRRQIDVNCHGTTNMVGAVVPHMVERKAGHILNITSDAGRRGFAGLAVYSGTKFYIEGFSQALRQELVDYGIRVTNIQPGDVATKLASRSSDNEAKTLYDFSKAGHKILEPEDVAQSVLYALSLPSHVALNELLIEPQAAPI